MEIIASSSTYFRLDPALSAAPVAAAPDAAAVQQFTALMQAPAAQINEPAAAGMTAIDAAANGPSSVGDKVLNGMQNASNKFQESWTRASNTLHADTPPSAESILSMHMDITMATLQVDLLSKGVGSATKNLNEMVRLS